VPATTPTGKGGRLLYNEVDYFIYEFASEHNEKGLDTVISYKFTVDRRGRITVLSKDVNQIPSAN